MEQVREKAALSLLKAAEDGQSFGLMAAVLAKRRAKSRWFGLVLGWFGYIVCLFGCLLIGLSVCLVCLFLLFGVSCFFFFSFWRGEGVCFGVLASLGCVS